MPTSAPNSRIEILTTITDRHLIPVVDMDRPDLKHLHIPANQAIGTSVGAAPPVNYAAAVAATLVRGSVAANSDLTFTAVEAGVGGNAFSVAIVQAVTINAGLMVEFDGTDATINLPTNGAGAPVAATATEIKAAWDIATYIPLPMAYPLTNYITVVVEGTGAGAVDAAAAADLTGGVNEIPGTGNGSAANGALYVNSVAPALYVNQGTAEEPVWATLVL